MSFGFGKEKDLVSEMSVSSSEFKMTKEDQDSQVYIGQGTKLDGKFEFEGPTYINCKLTGNIKSNTSITVGPLAEITGNIMGVEVTICGQVCGDVEASSKVFLKRPASVEGNVKCPKVAVEDGVVFNGNCTMKAPGEIVDLNRTITV